VPKFGTLTFTSCLIDGKTLASWHLREQLRRTATSATSRSHPHY